MLSPIGDEQMNDLTQIELNRYHGQIVEDVDKLVSKYRRIFDWDVPENDEAEARRLIIAAIREAIDGMS
jgi:hypothetical protein